MPDEFVKVVSSDMRRMQSDLRKLDSRLSRATPGALKVAAEATVLPEARREAPVGDPADYAGRRRPPPGRTKRSLRVLSSQRRVAVAAGYARLPYVGPVHWGWPRHNIAPNRWLERITDHRVREQFAERATREIDVEFRRIGWGGS